MRSVLSLLLLALPLTLAGHQPNVNHRELAKRAKGDVEKRGSGARWTFYSTGLGACGGWNKDSDYIVALNQQTFGYSYPSKYCGKKISMSYNGKTTTATIVDSCPGCPDDGLDLSPGLFSFFASQDMGVIYGTWSFTDGSGGGGGGGGGGDNDDDHTTTKKTTTHKTTHTTTHTTPTSTYTPPTTTPSTTSTEKKTTSSSSSPKSSSASRSASSSAAPSASLDTGLAAASGTVTKTSDNNPANLYSFSQAFLGLTGIVVAGAEDKE
ncbi:RlpA-like double-psi beta-barrel-protein domain-containing protein-containing protein [Favolaschia claudopus]|uniref:RlpA-like double-psi beta-barrel-protein domain-containing protein-containing protein n=1 Tax=Favolaschia claudopus TaxID=2862362 RepID=A0AAW0ANW5_9AGAR